MSAGFAFGVCWKKHTERRQASLCSFPHLGVCLGPAQSPPNHHPQPPGHRISEVGHREEDKSPQGEGLSDKALGFSFGQMESENGFPKCGVKSDALTLAPGKNSGALF